MWRPRLIPFLCKKGADIFSKNGNDLSCAQRQMFALCVVKR